MSERDAELEARPAEQDEFEPPGSFVERANVSDPSIDDDLAAALREQHAHGHGNDRIHTND